LPCLLSARKANSGQWDCPR